MTVWSMRVLTTISFRQVSYGGEWYPVCGHWFWDDEHGATTICKLLGLGTLGEVARKDVHVQHYRRPCCSTTLIVL